VTRLGYLVCGLVSAELLIVAAVIPEDDPALVLGCAVLASAGAFLLAVFIDEVCWLREDRLSVNARRRRRGRSPV
jgi:hypothetical protein